MKKRFLSFLLAVCLLLAVPGCGSENDAPPAPAEPAPEAVTEPEPVPEEPSEPEYSQREQNWRGDIEYLRNEYKKYHRDPFRFHSEEEFDWKLDQVKAKIGELTDTEIYFELAAVVAGMEDNHTSLVMEDIGQFFPIEVACFGNGIYLSCYMEGYEQFEPYLLREIVAVNGVDMSYIRKKGESLFDPTNAWAGKEHFAAYFIPAILDWAGCGYKEGYEIQILNEDQEVVTLELPVVSADMWSDGHWIWADAFRTLFYYTGENRVDYFEDERGSYIHAVFPDLQSYARTFEFFKEIMEVVRAHPDCDTLVVDVRRNPGGYIEYLREKFQLLKDTQIKHTYVATGGYSVSAAVIVLGICKEELGAVSIGEPTGQFTSGFSGLDVARSALPNAGIQFHISYDRYEGPEVGEVYYDENGEIYPWENTILPDVYVSQDIEDVRQGKDSVIEWILDHQE